jgi:hypothetical protein
MPPLKDDRSLGELFSELSRETSALVRQEVALAKTELSEKATRVGRNVGYVAMGGALAYAGVLTIIAAIVIILANAGMPSWASALLVGVVVLATGYIFTQKGLATLGHEQMAPTQTIDTMKENAQWVKGQMK